mmetsp:Transcript_53317/g.125370  ORF Transcript_53317/g.125370 Transcript_53317/m.125370 type:complete len:229 (+) Transcript_53317:187-873(+)
MRLQGQGEASGRRHRARAPRDGGPQGQGCDHHPGPAAGRCGAGHAGQAAQGRLRQRRHRQGGRRRDPGRTPRQGVGLAEGAARRLDRQARRRLTGKFTNSGEFRENLMSHRHPGPLHSRPSNGRTEDEKDSACIACLCTRLCVRSGRGCGRSRKALCAWFRRTSPGGQAGRHARGCGALFPLRRRRARAQGRLDGQRAEAHEGRIGAAHAVARPDGPTHGRQGGRRIR